MFHRGTTCLMARIQANVDMDVALWRQSGKGNKRLALITACQSCEKGLQFPWPQDFIVVRCLFLSPTCPPDCATIISTANKLSLHHGQVSIPEAFWKKMFFWYVYNTSKISVAKPLLVISAIWKWPQEPMLNTPVPLASQFWGPRKLTSSLLADSDTGTQCGRWNTPRNNTSACEIDTQLYTDCFCKECLFRTFFLMHLQKISVNCEWISSMAQRGVETGSCMTDFLGFGPTTVSLPQHPSPGSKIHSYHTSYSYIIPTEGALPRKKLVPRIWNWNYIARKAGEEGVCF